MTLRIRRDFRCSSSPGLRTQKHVSVCTQRLPPCMRSTCVSQPFDFCLWVFKYLWPSPARREVIQSIWTALWRNVQEADDAWPSRNVRIHRRIISACRPPARKGLSTANLVFCRSQLAGPKSINEHSRAKCATSLSNDAYVLIVTRLSSTPVVSILKTTGSSIRMSFPRY